MQHENKQKRFAGRGYYIALIACLAAVGISGYVFFRTARDSAVQTAAPAAISAAPDAASPSPSPAAAPKVSAGAAKPAEHHQTDQMDDAYEETMAQPTVLWPLQGEVIATFSQDALTYSQTMADWRTHEGLDIAAQAGSEVSATQAGEVTAVYKDDFLGNVVMVAHSGDLTTLYANLAEEPAVSVGDQVSAGQTLGQVGDSALSETAEQSHLHFEVFENGEAMDPLNYLP